MQWHEAQPCAAYILQRLRVSASRSTPCRSTYRTTIGAPMGPLAFGSWGRFSHRRRHHGVVAIAKAVNIYSPRR